MIFAYPRQNFTIKKRFRFFRKAKTIHDIDSPFVYDFCKYIVEDKRNFYIFPLGQLLYQEARSSGRKAYSIPPLTGKRLFRAVHHFKPDIALEIGAGDGLSTIYQATAMLSGDLFSLEAQEEQAAVAKKQIEELGLPNVALQQGEILSLLSWIIPDIQQVDFLFVSIQYPADQQMQLIEKLRPVINEKTVVVLEGIYHSPKRLSIWEELKKQAQTRLSIDLFDLGFLFFDSTLGPKRDYCLVSARQKPWRLGVFR